MPFRTIVTVRVEFTLPRILSTAWLSVMPRTASPFKWVIKSPERTPAFAAGVSSIGVTTLMTPSAIVTSMPKPPNSPRVCWRMSLKRLGLI